VSYPNFFESIKYGNDPFWVAKEFLNTLDGLAFCRRANYLASGVGQSTECAGCIFPNDPKDCDDEMYDGVFCYFFDDEVVVSEEAFFGMLKIACERYILIHPNSPDLRDVRSIIQRINDVV
jgi:hypothetical protein